MIAGAFHRLSHALEFKILGEIAHRTAIYLSSIILLFLLVSSRASALNGAVASPDRFGAEAATEILKSGGNAVDAAVATALTLAVTFPEAGNLGGGGFATVYFGGRGYFLDYRERAPQSARAGMYLDIHGDVVPDASTVGARAVGVPGTVMGLWDLHRRFGVLPWSRLFDSALHYARDGFLVSAQLKSRSSAYGRWLNGRTNFLRYFGGMNLNQPFKQPELAKTLQRIQRYGPKDFYHGTTARLLVAQMKRDHGLITLSDLAAYAAVWRAPLEADWAEYQIITAPPPSSGGVALVLLLKMKRAAAALFQSVPLNSAQYVHLVAEIEKRTFADRAAYLGDPDFYPVPIKQLIDDNYLNARARLISIDRPTPTDSVKPGIMESHDTTHFSITDAAGNAVANTYTLNGDLGNGEVVEGAGFLLNNEMDDFSAKPGTPNMFGVVGGTANAIAPGKRPLSSMTPTILTRDGRLALVIGTPGGSRIFTSIFQVISDWHDFHMALREAVARARFHHQLLPSNVIYEEPYRLLDTSVIAELERRGYTFENQGWNGDIQAIEIHGQQAIAVADPRGIGVGEVID